MSTLQEITTDVLGHLRRESGTNVHWPEAEVQDVVNFVYKITAQENKNVREPWSETSSDVVGEIYKLPDRFLTIEEVFWNGDILDPISIQEIRAIDEKWRERHGNPENYCLDYRVGYLMLWHFPSSEQEIKVVGAVVPNSIEPQQSPEPPYSNGIALTGLAVSFLLAKEGAGQNLERSAYWLDLGLAALHSDIAPKANITHVLRSVDNASRRQKGPRYPSNYPYLNWRNK